MGLQFLDDVIARFDSERKAFWEHEVSGAMYSDAPENLSEDDQKMLLAETAPWEVRTRDGGKNPWGTSYAPMYEGTLQDGNVVRRPDLAKMGPIALNLWKARLATINHPIMVARYSDVLWDLSNLVDPTSVRDFHHGHMAVDAYIEVSKGVNCEVPSDIQIVLNLQRALVVATELNDRNRIDQVATALLDEAEKTDLASMGVWIMPARAFANNRRVGEFQQNRLVHELEARLAEASIAMSGFAAEAAMEALLGIYKGISHIVQRQRIVKIYAETFVRQANTANPGVAIAWLDKVAQVLEDEKLAKDAEAVRLTMEKLGPDAMAEMKSHTFEISIDRKAIDEHIDQVLDVKHPFVALLRLAISLLPRCEQLRKRVVEHEKDFPLHSLFPISLIGDNGLPKATIGSADTDLDGRMVHEATREYQLTASFFKLGFDKACAKFSFSGKELAEACFSSALVRSEARGLVEEAVDGYMDQDWFKVVSMLVPQIEAMSRELLRLLDIPTTKRINGTTERKNMNDVFKDSRIVETLEEDLHFFLRTLFIDKRSYNLRNENAHGILSSESYNWATASLVMMSLILLSAVSPNCIYLINQKKTLE